MPKGRGHRPGTPENVVDVLVYIAHRPKSWPMPDQIAAYRYANGVTPEGTLVDATDAFRRPSEEPGPTSGSEAAERQEALF